MNDDEDELRKRRKRRRRWAKRNPEVYKERLKREWKIQKERMANDPEFRERRMQQRRNASLRYYYSVKRDAQIAGRNQND